jgi:hypothetical protein
MTNQYFNHQELIKRFKLLAMKEIPNLRIFDRTVGLFYAKRINGGIINYVPMKINSNGMADAYGLLKTQSGVIHLEFEFKTGKAVQTKEQKNWENFIVGMNGFFLVVRDEGQAVKQIKHYFGV